MQRILSRKVLGYCPKISRSIDKRGVICYNGRKRKSRLGRNFPRSVFTPRIYLHTAGKEAFTK